MAKQFGVAGGAAESSALQKSSEPDHEKTTCDRQAVLAAGMPVPTQRSADLSES